jgi:hypothetical protein
MGDQDVDYQYQAGTVPPPTALIATRFAALTPEQAARVASYCRSGLLDKYRGMELDEDSYFVEPRNWRLSVYDHAGACTDYRYRVQGDTIEPLDAGDEPLAWTTEIPAAKLYAALELGESLTSMYMRINEAQFAPDVEQEIAAAAVVDDPLIRCLFNDVFGAYQAAQLRRLQATMPL